MRTGQTSTKGVGWELQLNQRQPEGQREIEPGPPPLQLLPMVCDKEEKDRSSGYYWKGPRPRSPRCWSWRANATACQCPRPLLPPSWTMAGSTSSCPSKAASQTCSHHCSARLDAAGTRGLSNACRAAGRPTRAPLQKRRLHTHVQNAFGQDQHGVFFSIKNKNKTTTFAF